MKIELLKHQYEAIESDKKFVLLLGGVGAGKTYTGSIWMLKQMKEHPDSVDMICACSFGQLRKSTLASVFKNFTEWGISFNYNQNSSIITVNNTKRFYALSLESFDNNRGLEVGAAWFDEVAYSKYEAYSVMVGRIRDARGSLKALLTTTPNGIGNWLYDQFGQVNSDDKYKRVITAPTRSNKHLPNEYIEHLESQYDEKMREQELDGRFCNLTAGKVYRCFDREKNIGDTKVLSFGTVLIGMDFNVNPMTAVICRMSDEKIYVQDEVYLKDSDTFEMTKVLKEKGYSGATIIPDSTAKNRKTSGITDLEILRQAGFTVMSTRNPMVIDRVNNLNRLFTQNRIIINQKCQYLIADLEQVSWKGNKLDQTTNPMLTHVSDCLGYLCHKLIPLKPRSHSIFLGDR